MDLRKTRVIIRLEEEAEEEAISADFAVEMSESDDDERVSPAAQFYLDL